MNYNQMQIVLIEAFGKRHNIEDVEEAAALWIGKHAENFRTMVNYVERGAKCYIGSRVK